MTQHQTSAQVVAFPVHLARQPMPEADVRPYELLAIHMDRLQKQWGAQLYTSAAVQVRIARQLWARWNSRCGTTVLEANPRWEAARQHFVAVAYGKELPANIRQPTDREVDCMAQLISLQKMMG